MTLPAVLMESQFSGLGKGLIVTGVILVTVGLIFYYFNKIPFLGKLPGDILIKRENFTFYSPIVTSIILSIVISLILYIIRKLS